MAKLQGYEISDAVSTNEQDIDKIQYNGDPESVKYLSDEQKELLTQKLMAQFKSKVSDLHGMGT